MLVREFVGAAAQSGRLAALADFLASRARDQNVEPRVSRASFLKLASNMGISLTPPQLKDLAQKSPLNAMIVDVTGDDDRLDGPGEVIFQGGETVAGAGEEMTPDMAKLTVDNMAKRAIDIK
jgi:hypothetical protein